jgi:hypothetical protein
VHATVRLDLIIVLASSCRLDSVALPIAIFDESRMPQRGVCNMQGKICTIKDSL